MTNAKKKKYWKTKKQTRKSLTKGEKYKNKEKRGRNDKS